MYLNEKLEAARLEFLTTPTNPDYSWERAGRFYEFQDFFCSMYPDTRLCELPARTMKFGDLRQYVIAEVNIHNQVDLYPVYTFFVNKPGSNLLDGAAIIALSHSEYYKLFNLLEYGVDNDAIEISQVPFTPVS